jgi:hypothetical protein
MLVNSSITIRKILVRFPPLCAKGLILFDNNIFYGIELFATPTIMARIGSKRAARGATIAFHLLSLMNTY